MFSLETGRKLNLSFEGPSSLPLFPFPLPFPLLSLPFSPVPLLPSVFPSPLSFFLLFYHPPLTFSASSPSPSCSREVLTKSGHHCYHLRRTENRFPNQIFPYLWKTFEFDPNLYINCPIQHHRHFTLAVTQAVHSSCRRWSNNFQQLLYNIHLAPKFLASESFLNVLLLRSLNKQVENYGAFAHFHFHLFFISATRYIPQVKIP